MKKIFLLLAFTGIVGAACANSTGVHPKKVATTIGDDKKGDDKKKDTKACCKKDANAKKSCCKAKSETKAETTPAPAKK